MVGTQSSKSLRPIDPVMPKLLELRHSKKLAMKHRKKTDDGLRFIGRHASVARRELEKKAETLYRGKVLIDR